MRESEPERTRGCPFFGFRPARAEVLNGSVGSHWFVQGGTLHLPEPLGCPKVSVVGGSKSAGEDLGGGGGSAEEAQVLEQGGECRGG